MVKTILANEKPFTKRFKIITFNLYPPQYRELRHQAQEAISVTLFNEESPSIWEQVSDWVDRKGSISNRELCQIAELDTLKASKQLKRWVDQGLLVSNQTTGSKNRIYFKPDTEGGDDNPNLDLLANASESKADSRIFHPQIRDKKSLS